MKCGGGRIEGRSHRKYIFYANLNYGVEFLVYSVLLPPFVIMFGIVAYMLALVGTSSIYSSFYSFFSFAQYICILLFASVMQECILRVLFVGISAPSLFPQCERESRIIAHYIRCCSSLFRKSVLYHELEMHVVCIVQFHSLQACV